MKSISIITSVYNTPVEYLEEYVNSLISQLFQNFEVVLVDDGSTKEETINYLKKISQKYPDKFKVHFMGKNQGIFACRNWGISNSKGEYICILDSDDYYETSFLQEMIGPVLADNSIDMVVGRGFTLVNNQGEKIGKVPKQEKRQTEYTDVQVLTGTRLFKRTLLLENNIFFPKNVIYEDNAFFVVATFFAKKIARNNSYGYINRVHQSSFSHNDLYKKLTYKMIPITYLEEKLYSSNTIVSCEKTKKSAVQGEVLEILATCACIFDRNSTEDEVEKVNQVVCKFVKKNIKNYLKYSFTWMIKGPGPKKEKMVFCGFYLSIKLRIVSQYTKVVHKLINKIEK